jgi:hypothetical protein
MVNNTTIEIPVTPSIPVTSSLYVGFLLLKSDAIKAKFSGDEFIRRGKSHNRWFPACKMTPITIAPATIWENKVKEGVRD